MLGNDNSAVKMVIMFLMAAVDEWIDHLWFSSSICIQEYKGS